MIEAIKTRELITLQSSGAILRATCHWPAETDWGLQKDRKENIGVLFLNSMSLPRCATGDSAVYWAESFAACGYPSFRIDMAGLGDSDGDIPDDLLAEINSGEYAKPLPSLIKDLVKRFDLSGLVIVGLCAGAVSTIFAAAASKECKGLVLLDPFFHLPKMVRSQAREGLAEWTSKSSFGGFARKAYHRLKAIRRSLRRNALPANANRPLLKDWEKIASRKTPVLLFKAPGLDSPNTKRNEDDFDYIEYVLKLAGPRNEVRVQSIAGTDHSFANRMGRAAVSEHVERWLGTHFPLTRPESGMAKSSAAIDHMVTDENHAPCL